MAIDTGPTPDGLPGKKAPTSRRFSEGLIERTRIVFQERTDRILTAEDARQILENLVGFFSTLNEWDRGEPPRQRPKRSISDQIEKNE